MSTTAKKLKKALVVVHMCMCVTSWVELGHSCLLGTQIQALQNIYQCNGENLDFTFSQVLAANQTASCQSDKFHLT